MSPADGWEPQRSCRAPTLLPGSFGSFSACTNIQLPPDSNKDVLVLCESTVLIVLLHEIIISHLQEMISKLRKLIINCEKVELD